MTDLAIKLAVKMVAKLLILVGNPTFCNQYVDKLAEDNRFCRGILKV